MSASKSNLRHYAQAEELLKERLQKILPHEEWTPYRTAVKKIAAEFGLEVLDCAAALAFLALGVQPNTPQARKPVAAPELKMVRYRLEVGRKHHATEDGIKKLLTEESGVENRLIKLIDIYNDHTLVQLPDGMPEEIYQHLKSVLLNRQPLRIKRLDGHARERAKNAGNFRRGKHSPAPAPKNQAIRHGRREPSPKQKD